MAGAKTPRRKTGPPRPKPGRTARCADTSHAAHVAANVNTVKTASSAISNHEAMKVMGRYVAVVQSMAAGISSPPRF
jgi:hypothetical protein